MNQRISKIDLAYYCGCAGFLRGFIKGGNCDRLVHRHPQESRKSY
ncbi:hypothetical protein [Dendronalium sp. ChiSLP03b]|nr:hypothetical protein [Dendronalium sp. ChiSLP03b]MDZ8205190.1 hypothetical protein [Dendronalium sp. ChiSLP03b]